VIFVDTGPFLARWLARDQHHAEAIEGWRALGAARVPLATSGFVVDETLTLLGRHAGYAFAAARGRDLYASGALTILRPDRRDEVAALGWFERYADQRVSFTDCVSLALLGRHGIRRVFTFDRHFALAGYEVGLQ